MPLSILHLGVGAVLSTLSSTAFATQYQVDGTYTGANWLDAFQFTQTELNNGFVNYVNESTAVSSGLYKIDSGDVVFGVDSSETLNSADGGDVGRKSVRLEGTTNYNQGLFILDVKAIPSVCGMWPGFWTLGSGTWPVNGEIDIIEGVNLNTANQYTLHTNTQCTTSQLGQTGTANGNNCALDTGGSDGCGVDDVRTDSFGAGFNSNDGGIYAMEWDNDANAIKTWFFPRGSSMPASLSTSSPDTSDFGTPAANFAGDCDIAERFQDQRFIFTNDFCGDWAGNVYATSGCPMYTDANGAALSGMDSCKQYVAENPSDFADAFWRISSFKTYQKKSVSSSSSRTFTSTRASSSTVRSASSTPAHSSSVRSSSSTVHSASSTSARTSSVRSSSIYASSTPARSSSVPASSTPAASSSIRATSSSIRASSSSVRASSSIRASSSVPVSSSTYAARSSVDTSSSSSVHSASSASVVASSSVRGPVSSSIVYPSSSVQGRPTVHPSGTSSAIVYPSGTSSSVEYPASMLSSVAYPPGISSSVVYPSGPSSSVSCSSGSSSSVVHPSGASSSIAYPSGTLSSVVYPSGASLSGVYPTTSSALDYPIGNSIVPVYPGTDSPALSTPCTTSSASSTPGYPVYPDSKSSVPVYGDHPSYPSNSVQNDNGYLPSFTPVSPFHPGVTSKPAYGDGYDSYPVDSKTTITTTYTTTYVDVCETGYTTMTTTYAVTYCPTTSPVAKPTPGSNYPVQPPPGFQITTKICSTGCGSDGPKTVTVTVPCSNCGGYSTQGTGELTTPVPAVPTMPSYGNANKPSSSDENKPSSGGDNKPSSGGDNKPSSGGDNKPSSGGDNKPSSGGDNKPSYGNDDTAPAQVYQTKVITLSVVAVPASVYYAQSSPSAVYGDSSAKPNMPSYSSAMPSAPAYGGNNPSNAVGTPTGAMPQKLALPSAGYPAFNGTISYGTGSVNSSAAKTTQGMPQFTGAASSLKAGGMVALGAFAALLL